jgi:Mn2+/Fe2+ NRAMP family transporter
MVWGALIGGALALLFLVSWITDISKRNPLDSSIQRVDNGLIAVITVLGAIVGGLLGYFAFVNGDASKKHNGMA